MSATQWNHDAPIRREENSMNPMSLLTMPLGLLRENYAHHASTESSQGEPQERHMALAVGLVGMLAAVVVAFA